MPKSPRRRSSGGRKKESQESGGSRDPNWRGLFTPPVKCNTCGDLSYYVIIRGHGLGSSCGCNGIKFTYHRV
jgi:hypothetical protein